MTLIRHGNEDRKRRLYPVITCDDLGDGGAGTDKLTLYDTWKKTKS